MSEKIQSALEDIKHQRMDGEIESEAVTGEVVTIVLKACIITVDGISTQRGSIP